MNAKEELLEVVRKNNLVRRDFFTIRECLEEMSADKWELYKKMFEFQTLFVYLHWKHLTNNYRRWT